ncbi:MAG TPA: DUF3383 domain-containing protein [Mycobacterium sp.]
MSIGLSVERLINVDIFLNPQAAPTANINSLLIVGTSDVIDVGQRIRSFADISEVATAFGTSAEDYKAALAFFSQSPQPNQLYIGRWAQTATAGLLVGGALSAAQQLLTNFTAIVAGSLKVSIDGAPAVQTTGMDFSAQTNLNGVAAVISAAVAGATCTWDGSHFILKSDTTGATSAIAVPVATTAGTNIATVCGWTAALGARTVAGIVAETALQAVTILAAGTTYWYGLNFAYAAMTDADHLAVAGFVQAASPPHLYGLTTGEATAIDGTSTADIGSVLAAAEYTRSFCQYSTTNPYSAASMFGRILTTDFNANNTTITLMYKIEPGITAEVLTSAQANVLDSKRYSYFAAFENSTAIIVNGTCAGDAYIDEIVGIDWFATRVQTDVFNLLYTSKTKIPQTDAGNQQITNAITGSCKAAVNNGLVAPGTWNQDGFGQLSRGDVLPTGYYIFAPPIATQAQQDREARKSVPIQVALKLAGAVQTVDILVNVNR